MEKLKNKNPNQSITPSFSIARAFALADRSTIQMAGISGYSTLAPKAKNLLVAGGLTSFVFGVYFYTMRAVGGTDELQVAIDKFEHLKKDAESKA